MEHVNIPVFEDSTLTTATPFVLLVVKISTPSSDSPFGETSISTDEIEDPVKIGFNKPELTIFLVVESTMVNVGVSIYPLPPFKIVRVSIVLEFFNTIFGDTLALGLSVLSEE